MTAILTAARNAEIIAWAQSAERAVGSDVRTDTRRSASPDIDAQRVTIRVFAGQTARMAAAQREVLTGVRVDTAAVERRALDLVEALASGCGLEERDGQIRTDAASFLPGELTAMTGRVIEQPEVPQVLTATIPVLSVDPWKEYVADEYVGYSGRAEIARPGVTSVPRADAEVSQAQQSMHTIHTSTRIDWQEAMFGANSVLNVVERKAQSARKANRKFLEDALANGVPGTTFQGITDLVCPEYYSTVDYSPGSAATIGQKHADMVAAIQFIQTAAQDRGMEANTIWAGPRLIRAITPSSNLDAGGSMTGSELLRRVLADLGISRIIRTPSLRGFRGQSTRDGWMVGHLPDDDGLRQFLGMDTSPARSATDLLGDETLWIMRHGGCNLASAVSFGLGSFSVE